MTGVGVTPSSRWMSGFDAVGGEHFQGGALGRAGQGVGVLAHEERAVDPLARRYSQMAWVMARMWASVKVPLSGVPRWPLVPKITRCVGSSKSGLHS